jgi:glyceraldehyde 3-phosphate dehydrogenase
MGKIKIGLMGFGEIGRDIYRLSTQLDDVDVTAISDIGKPEILHYLLNAEGLPDQKEVSIDGNYLVCGKQKTRMVKGIAPSDVPWDVLDVDYVIDTTQKYSTKEDMADHIKAGAKRVILASLPTNDIDAIIIPGINDDSAKASDVFISAGSATTNALAIMLKVIDDAFGIEYAMMTSIHAYTSDQPIRDRVAKDFRRSRSAAENIIPNISRATSFVEKILPKFAGKIDGSALNVPVGMGSLLDLSSVLTRIPDTVEEFNAAIEAGLNKIPDVAEVVHDPIVSSDVIGNRKSVVFDELATLKTKGRMVKTLSWYDNSLAQAARILDVVKIYGKLDGKGGNA